MCVPVTCYCRRAGDETGALDPVEAGPLKAREAIRLKGVVQQALKLQLRKAEFLGHVQWEALLRPNGRWTSPCRNMMHLCGEVAPG